VRQFTKKNLIQFLSSETRAKALREPGYRIRLFHPRGRYPAALVASSNALYWGATDLDLDPRIPLLQFLQNLRSELTLLFPALIIDINLNRALPSGLVKRCQNLCLRSIAGLVAADEDVAFCLLATFVNEVLGSLAPRPLRD
jgi:hypothetical protein